MKALLKVAGSVAVLLVLFGFGYAWRDIQRGHLPSMDTVKAGFGSTNARADVSPVQLFRETYSRILTDYRKTVDPTDLKYAGMEGLMASLGDPHTLFMEPRQAEQFALETMANFVGIGARLSPDPLGAKVVVIFEDSPAQHSGLKIGDIVSAVDGVKVSGKDIDSIVGKIRGKPGTQVRITVLRSGSPKPIDLRAIRAKIITPTVESAMIPGTSMGRVSIATFSEPTADQFDRAVSKLEKQGMKGLVIDLRGNPGGLLETAVEMLSRFVEDKVVVKMKGRGDREEIARTYVGLNRKWRYPIAVLINEESASASEIFAGCVRAYRLGTLVGEHSYGKASVQNVRMLVGGASAKITIARYYLPGGEDIGRKVDEDGQYIEGGLKPDVEAKWDPDRAGIFGDIKTDPQLQKAVAVLKSKS